MAGQGQQHSNLYTAGQQMGDQPQITREGQINQPHSNTRGSAQNANFLNQTGEQVKTMAHGAADIMSGAASGALGIARGAAVGAANIAEGAASAVKNTLGMNSPADPQQGSNYNSSNATLPTTNPSTTTTNHPNTRI